MPRVLWFGIIGAAGHDTTGSLAIAHELNLGRQSRRRYSSMRSLFKYICDISPETGAVRQHALRQAVFDGLRLLTTHGWSAFQAARRWMLCPTT